MRRPAQYYLSKAWVGVVAVEASVGVLFPSTQLDKGIRKKIKCPHIKYQCIFVRKSIRVTSR